MIYVAVVALMAFATIGAALVWGGLFRGGTEADDTGKEVGN